MIPKKMEGGILMVLPRSGVARVFWISAAALSLGVFGPAAARGTPQAGPWSERVPSTDFVRAHPRWLPYVHLNQQELPIDVDAREVVHMVPFNYGDDRIRYRNTRFETRKADGFSRLEESVATREELGAASLTTPDVAVEENATDSSLSGRVHVVWGAGFINPANQRGRADLAWRVRDAQGWGPVRYLNASGDQRWLDFPQALVDENGTLHVVATLYDQNVPPGQPPKETLVSFSTRGTAPVMWREIPGAGGTRSPARLALRKDVNGTLWIAAAWRRFNAATFMNDAYYALGQVGADGSVAWTQAVKATSKHDVAPVDVALDQERRCRLVWSSNTTRAVHYGTSQEGFEPGTLLHPSPDGLTPGAPGIAVDSRGNIHVVFDGLGYAARLRRPEGSYGSWYVQERMLAPRSLEFSVSEMKRGVRDLKVSRRDALHVTGGGVYTRTMEYGLGRRDPAALVGVFPGGAVNVTNGNLHAELELYRTRGVGPAQSVRLYYNSLDSGPGMLGPGWRLSYEISLIDHDFPQPADGVQRESVTVFLSDGRAVHFVEDPALGYLVPEEEFGFSARLDVVGGRYELRTKYGEVLGFTPEGKLSRWIDAAGNFLELQWSSEDGRLEAIRDMAGNGGAGRTASVGYEEFPTAYGRRIWQIRDPRGSVSYLTYSGGNFSSVVVAGQVSYGFEVGPGGRLAKWNTPEGVVGGYGWRVVYHPDGRVSEVLDPLETPLAVGYATLEGAADEVWVQDRRGFVTRYEGELRRGLLTRIEDALVRSGGAGLTPIERRFDAFGNLVAERDRRGRWTTWAYEVGHPWVRDNLAEVRLPESGTQPTVRYEEYTVHGRPRKVTAYAGAVERVTRHEYDFAGRLTRTVFPDVTQADGGVRSGGAVSYGYQGPRGALSEWSDEDGVKWRATAWDPVTSLPAQ